MKANDYHLIERCVEDGLAYGWARAHKHNDNQPVEQVLYEQQQAIMAEIAEWFIFDDVQDGS